MGIVIGCLCSIHLPLVIHYSTDYQRFLTLLPHAHDLSYIHVLTLAVLSMIMCK